MSEHDNDIGTGDELDGMDDQIPTVSSDAGEFFLPADLQDPDVGFADDPGIDGEGGVLADYAYVDDSDGGQ